MNKLEYLLKKNSSIILTLVSVTGFITTTVLAVKATPKAVELINNKKKEDNVDKLTKIDIFKTCYKQYIPSFISGVSTIICIFGIHYTNKRIQTSLISAYAILDNAYKEYIAKTEEIFGEKSKDIRYEIARSNYDSEIIHNEDKKLFFEMQTMTTFESTIEDVLNAEKMLNYELASSGKVSVNDFFRFLDLDMKKITPKGDNIGWCDNNEYHEIKFNHEKFQLEDGLECILINMSPCDLNYNIY